jgi:hypothetical protein
MTTISSNTIAATQYYESSVYDRSSGEGFTFLTLPRRALAEHLSEVVLENGAPSHAYIFIAFLEPSDSELVESGDEASLLSLIDRARGVDAHDDFTRYLAHETIIPFESSPLDAKSLTEIASATGATAALGYFGTDHPLILITLPAGIVICGAAIGVAEALRDGLRFKILKLLGLHDPSVPSQGHLAQAMLLFGLLAAQRRTELEGDLGGAMGEPSSEEAIEDSE